MWNASRDGFDNVLRFDGRVQYHGIDIDRRDLWKFCIKSKTHPETVRRTLWTIGALIVTVLIYFFPFNYFIK